MGKVRMHGRVPADHPIYTGATGFWIHLFDVWEVEERYALCGEKLGSEGRARREIITELCGRGWIRVRHRKGKRAYWCVSWVPDPRWRIHLQRFLRMAAG